MGLYPTKSMGIIDVMGVMGLVGLLGATTETDVSNSCLEQVFQTIV